MGIIKHGHKFRGKSSKEYRAWVSMKTRTTNPNYPHYDRYGGRGIRVCKRWLDSFDNFLQDVGEAPSPRHSIDRRDNEKDYEPGNVRWATPEQQSFNKSNTYFLTIDGETLSILEWSKRSGLTKQCIKGRIIRGWTPELAVKTPLKQIYTR